LGRSETFRTSGGKAAMVMLQRGSNLPHIGRQSRDGHPGKGARRNVRLILPPKIVSALCNHLRLFVPLPRFSDFDFDRSELSVVGNVRRAKAELVTRAQMIDYNCQFVVNFLFVGTDNFATSPFDETVNTLAQLSEGHDLEHLTHRSLHD